MYSGTTHTKLIKFLKAIAIGILVVVGTFPENDWSFSTGVDPSLLWVYNYLFEHGLKQGMHIIFPHGPLAFFMYPLPENVIWVTLITSVLKILLVFNLFRVTGRNSGNKWLITFVFAYLFSVVALFNQLILANILLFYANYFNREKWVYKAGAFVLTAFAFYIRSYVAILSGVITFSFLSYYLFSSRNFKKLATDVLTILGFILAFWIAMYGTLSGFIGYVTGMVHLAGDNSTAASYYPYNNWWILSVFLVIVSLLPFANRTKKSYFFGILILLSLFAAWKHGMAREDFFHVKGLLIYALIALSVFVIFNGKNFFLNIAFSVVALFFLTLNMQHTANYFPLKYELFGVNNFVGFITEFSALKEKSNTESRNNIEANKLPQTVIDSLNNHSVDVYPWDYSVIAANHFNWQPRVVIQSYAAYTSWLDQKNAEHFGSKKAPDFLIWQLNASTDVNGCAFAGVDNRYLLNDEPRTLLRILEYYSPWYRNEKFVIFRKKANPESYHQSVLTHETTRWGEWNPVPETSDGLLRLNMNFRKSLPERIKSFFYKDEQIWIYLKLSNRVVHKYRIIPENAKDGIWIAPYIFDTSQTTGPRVEQVLFTCSNTKIMNNQIDFEWQKTSFADPHYVRNFWNKTADNNDSTYLYSANNFESPATKFWSDAPEIQLNKSEHFSGSTSQLVGPDSFSSAFSFPLDSLPQNHYRITVDCEAKSDDYTYSKNISLVLAVDDAAGHVVWKGTPVDEQLIDRNQWNNIFNFIDYDHNKPGCTLKAYIWNPGKEHIYIDDLRVTISGAKIF